MQPKLIIKYVNVDSALDKSQGYFFVALLGCSGECSATAQVAQSTKRVKVSNLSTVFKTYFIRPGFKPDLTPLYLPEFEEFAILRNGQDKKGQGTSTKIRGYLSGCGSKGPSKWVIAARG